MCVIVSANTYFYTAGIFEIILFFLKFIKININKSSYMQRYQKVLYITSGSDPSKKPDPDSVNIVFLLVSMIRTIPDHYEIFFQNIKKIFLLLAYNILLCTVRSNNM